MNAKPDKRNNLEQLLNLKFMWRDGLDTFPHSSDLKDFKMHKMCRSPKELQRLRCR